MNEIKYKRVFLGFKNSWLELKNGTKKYKRIFDLKTKEPNFLYFDYFFYYKPGEILK